MNERIAQEFREMITGMADEYMTAMLKKHPVIAEESIQQDESGDVAAGLIEGFIKHLQCEPLPEEW